MQGKSEAKILNIKIEQEMERSYIDYAMSVIVGRALPDVRDGLKPVHRRILYAMFENDITPDKPHKKSARVVGDVMAKYHPHGDQTIYDTMVRLAQSFAIRYQLIDGHGNFGSVDGDSAAAMRYTEVRLTRIAMEMLADIKKETVDFIPNYDESIKEPVVLPAKLPNLLINGSSGIAVGMATNIPPHNLGEVIDGLVALIDEPEISDENIINIIKGPDFPTGGIIMGRDGILQAYRTGRGSVRIRAQAQIEEKKGGRVRIVVTEIPYLVNKAKLIEKIAELVREKKIDGITDLRDESDRQGMRIVIELRRDANAQIILNRLYKNTKMEDTFGVILLALVDGKPRVLSLREMLYYYLEHRKDVITRRSRYELSKAQDRAHIVEGLRIALAYLDEVIKTIRRSQTVDIARQELQERFHLSQRQAQAILDMRLQRLTGLEREKLENEYAELLERINYLQGILNDEQKILNIVKEELLSLKEKYADKRRTVLKEVVTELNAKDLIPREEVVVSITRRGYIKRVLSKTFRSQRRGGRGVATSVSKNGDVVQHLFVTTTHHNLLFFTNQGRLYRLKVYEVPEASRLARGMALINLLSLEQQEEITAVIAVEKFTDDNYLLMATKNGIIKRSRLSEYFTSRRDGIIALKLKSGDQLIEVKRTSGTDEIILGTREGMAIRFSEKDVTVYSRVAGGVRGIKLSKNDEVIGMEIIRPFAYLLVVTENGYGKCTAFKEYRTQGRGGKGIINYRRKKRNGLAVGIRTVTLRDELLLTSQQGSIIRLKVTDVSVTGRATQGVKLIRLSEQDRIVAVAKVSRKEGE